MPRKSYESEAIQRIRNPLRVISSEAEETFLRDLETAIGIQQQTGLTWVPYVNPDISGKISAEASFSGPQASFAFLVRPIDESGASTKEFYGVPIIVQQVTSLEESGLLERRISAIRMGKEIDPGIDKLMGILSEKSESEPTRFNQDLLVGLCLGDVLKAYQDEDRTQFGPIQVQSVTIIIPTNEGYKTEGVGFVRNGYFSPFESLCFGYGIGGMFYRGRPIVNAVQCQPRLVDIDQEGNNAFFNITSLAQVREESTDIQVGNFTVVALPLVGQVEGYRPSYREDLLGMTMRGGESRTLGLDVAAFSTGRVTGTESRLVPGRFDSSRPVGIIDATVLVLTPSKMQEYVSTLLQ